MSRAANTVNVVTTDGPGGRAGVTVSAMTPVSADSERPTLLICVHHLSSACGPIFENRNFCVNVLRDDQSYIADIFAGRITPPGGDKFSCSEWIGDRSPRVVDPLVAFDCDLVQNFRVGTHVVFVGEVCGTFISAGMAPLIYSNRAYRTTAGLSATPASIQTGSEQELIRLGCLASLAPAVLSAVIGRFSSVRPQAQIELIECSHIELMMALRSGGCDIALTFDAQRESDFVWESLSAVRPHALIHDSHELAAADQVSLKDLAGKRLALINEPVSLRRTMTMLSGLGLKTKPWLLSNSFGAVRNLAGCGLAASVLELNASAGITFDGPDVRTLPILEEAEPARIVMAYSAGRRPSEPTEKFKQVCRECLSGGEI